MREEKQNLWYLYHHSKWVCVTTNGSIKKNGEAVMGAGVALQAKQMIPSLPKVLGYAIDNDGGNIVRIIAQHIISFPVKHKWYEKADIELIKRSCRQLIELLNRTQFDEAYLVPPGCGNGGLHWSDVKPVIEPLLDDRVIITSLW